MIILGIDTALRCTGYGLIEVEGKRFTTLDCGVIKNKQKDPHSECLRRLAGGVNELVATYQPDVAAIEGVFFLKNPKTAMILGMARGAVISVLAQHQIKSWEYAPRRAKQAVTGSGASSKEQVALILAGMLKLNISDIPDDATDALSLCVCHALTAQSHGGIHLKESL